ncbi:MAG: hypothetical protein ACRYFS_07715 [Janthinobacterium lividum]
MIKRILAGGALALMLAMPAAMAQTPADAPPTPPATPAPANTNPTPSTAPESTASPTPAPASSQPTPKKSNRFRIGPEVGVFFLSSGKARNEFGNSAVSLGLGLGSISQASTQGRLALDLQIQYQTRDGNHLFLAPLGVAYRKALNQGGPNVAYVGLTADLDFVDIRAGDYNVHSGVRTAFGASPLVGVSFGDSGFLEARYLYVSGVKGFDLSGLNLSAGFRF